MATLTDVETTPKRIGIRSEVPLAEPASRGLQAARVLSAILVGLLATASGAGLFLDDVYQDPAPVAAMFRGYDLVALLIIAPLLAVTLLPALRRSVRAQLLWTGGLAYAVYHSSLYVFGTEFNDIFLVHVAVFSLSVFAFGLAIANLDVPGIARRFRDRTPARSIAAILLLLAATLAVFWISPSIRFAVTGEIPAEGSELIVPTATTHLGWVLDLSLLVPAYALAGVLLWRRAAWGFVLATVVLVGGLEQQVDYMTALVFQANSDIPGANGFDALEPVIATLYLIGAVVLLTRIRGVEKEGSHGDLSQDARISGGERDGNETEIG
jgi:hypothetical protein